MTEPLLEMLAHLKIRRGKLYYPPGSAGVKYCPVVFDYIILGDSSYFFNNLIIILRMIR